MTAEIWVWIAIAAAIGVVALWPVLSPRKGRLTGAAPATLELARARMELLEAELDRIEIDQARRAGAERALVLAGAALAGGGKRAAAKAVSHADRGLGLLSSSSS